MAPSDPASDPILGKQLFGRELESRSLSSLLDQVSHSGEGRIVLVHGAAGIGKSSLIRSLSKTFGLPAHTFAMGKCTRAQNQPQMFPVGDALAQLINGALIDDEARLRLLRDKLMVAVAGDEAIVGELVPEILQIIGQGWRRPELPATLAQSRIRTSLCGALGAFALPGKPLLLTIDDIQWADPLTLSFIESFADNLPDNLLLVLAYRDPWSDGTLPDQQFVDLITKLAERSADLALGPISRQDVADLMVARLGDFDPRLAWLATTLGETTGGNPFSLIQRLHLLDEERAITFDRAQQSWTGHRGAIMASISREADNDLLKARLERLTPQHRQIVELLSVLAVPSPDSLIAEILGLRGAKLAELLDTLQGVKLVRRDGDSHAVSHDRVLDAAITGLDRAGKAQIQINAARAILQAASRLQADWPFRAASLIKEAILSGHQPKASDCVLFAEHLLHVAATNRRSGAIDVAAGLIHAFHALSASQSKTDWWEDHYALMIRAEFLNIDLLLVRALVDLAAKRIDRLAARARSPADKAATLQRRARVLTVRSDYDGAIRAALEGLALLGIDVPRHPSDAQCQALQQRLDVMLANRDAASLVELPLCEAPGALLVSQLLAALLPALFDNANLRFFHCALLVEFTLEQGVCPASPYGLSWYAVALAHEYDRHQEGLALAKAALAMIEQHGFEAGRTETLVAIDQLSPWVEPAPACLGWVNAAIEAGQASGDLGMTCYARNHLISDLLYLGVPLDEVEREIEDALALTRQIAFTDIEQLIGAQLAFIRLMRHGEAPPAVDSSIRSPATLYWVHLNRAIGAYMMGDPAGALAHFAALEPVEWSVPAHIDTTLRALFTPLAMALVLPAATAQSAMTPYVERLRRWALVNPEAFESAVKLIEGEMARLSGDLPAALAAFDAAATASGDFPHRRALAHELMARASRQAGLADAAAMQRNAAMEEYHAWGAQAKAQALETEKLSGLVTNERPAILSLTTEQALALSRGWFDETHQQRLGERILSRMADLCKAGSGCIIRFGESAPYLVAELAGPADIPTHQQNLFGISRTRKVLLALDAPRSLTLPLLRRGSLIGAIHLVGHGIGQSLLSRQVQVLELLSAQAEIAMSAAMLHTRLLEESEKATTTQDSLRSARIEMARNSHWIALGEFTATLAHEINQPLSGIALHAAATRRWLERETPVIEEATRGLAEISSAAERAADIVRALRVLTRQEKRNVARVDLNQLVREVCAILETEILQSQVQVIIEISPVDPCVTGDEVQLQQVILNLVSNALDALVTVPAPQRKVIITVSTETDKALARVRDNGPGVPAHMAERIFTPLVTSKQKGMGMGLAICKSVMAAHNGRITLEDQYDQGCSFILELPLAAEQ